MAIHALSFTLIELKKNLQNSNLLRAECTRQGKCSTGAAALRFQMLCLTSTANLQFPDERASYFSSYTATATNTQQLPHYSLLYTHSNTSPTDRAHPTMTKTGENKNKEEEETSDVEMEGKYAHSDASQSAHVSKTHIL